MSEISKQLHSLIITNRKTEEKKNTWDDWNLVPSSRPDITPPKLKSYTLDIPGADGKIDLSSSLTGYPAFENRTGSIEFLVMNQGLDSSLGDTYGYNVNNIAWSGRKTEIMNFLHGQEIQVELEDIADWYFVGRMSVNEWKSSANYSTITLDYDLEPYRYSITDTGDLWKWDPFNFNTGVIKTYTASSMKFNGNTSFTIVGTTVPVMPTIYVTTACTLTTPHGTFRLPTGSSKNPMIYVYPGKQTWTFSGATGSAAVYFRERSF